jgi:hypothetical protein
MAALLALIPSRDWFYGAAIVALLMALSYERHEGAAHETAALAASTAKLQAETSKQTAELQARAQMAEQAYDKERAAAAALPPIQPVRLCINAGGGSVVPKAGAAKPGAADTSTAAGNLQPVPTGNPASGVGGTGPDISKMLSAFAVSADEINARLREYQKRE